MLVLSHFMLPSMDHNHRSLSSVQTLGTYRPRMLYICNGCKPWRKSSSVKGTVKRRKAYRFPP